MAGNCSLKKTLLVVVLGVCAICYGAKTLSSSVLRLRHIESAEAIEIFGKLGIGESISKVKGVNAIIISDSSEELAKARAIMKVADSESGFTFEQLPVGDEDIISIVKRVEKAIRDISVGTFREPVFSAGKVKAVIGLSGEKLIVGSTPEMVKQIVAVIGGVSADESVEEAVVEITEIEKVAIEIEEKFLHDKVEQVVELKSSEGEAELFDDLVLALEKAEIATAAVEKEEAIEPVEVVVEKIEQPVEKDIVSQEDSGELESFLKQVQKEKAEVEIVEKVVEAEPVITLAEPFIPDGNEVLDLELPEKVNIINLLDLLGEYLQLDYLYDAAQIKGDIMLKIQGSITIKDLYSYVEAILKSKGFAMVRGRGNLVMIVKTADAINYDPTLVGKDRSVKAGNVFVTNVFELDHIDTVVGAKLLADMKLGGAVVQIPELGSLIITDYAYRMQRIEDLLRLIDKPGEPKSISYRTIEYISVSSLIPKLEKLAQELGSVSIVSSVKSATPAKATRKRGKPAPKPTPAATAAAGAKDTVFLEADDRTNRIIMIGLEEQIATVNKLIDSLDIEQQDLRKIRNYIIQNIAAEEAMDKLAELGIASSGKGSAKKPVTPSKAKGATAGSGATQDATEDLAQIVLLDATNSLLVNGTVQQHEKIAMILAYVDQVSSDAAVPYVIYPLEYQEPSDIAETLNQIIEKTLKSGDGKDKVVKAPSFEEDTIEVVADEKSFSLIVYASRKNQEWIGKLITQLDQKRPQVLIEVTLVEITESDTFNKDLDIVTSIPDLVNTSGLTGIATGGTAMGSAMVAQLAGVTDRNRYLDFGSNSGSGTAFYGDDAIQALLTLVETKNYGRVLATPKILVNDNEDGTLETSDSTYVAKTGSIRSGTNEDIETITEHVEYKSGIVLSITPHISEGNLLLLDISMSRSDFKESALDADGNPLPPGVISTDIETSVTVPDRSTIILGGMNKLNQSKSGTKVPLLGDIPLIGELFRSSNEGNIQSKLYIFVKAQVSRPREGVDGLPDLVRISREYSDSFENAEKKFQEHQTITGIDPEPMEPERALEMK